LCAGQCLCVLEEYVGACVNTVRVVPCRAHVMYVFFTGLTSGDRNVCRRKMSFGS